MPDFQNYAKNYAGTIDSSLSMATGLIVIKCSVVAKPNQENYSGFLFGTTGRSA